MKHIFNVVQPPSIIGVFLLENSGIFRKAEKNEHNRHHRFQSLRNLTSDSFPEPSVQPLLSCRYAALKTATTKWKILEQRNIAPKTFLSLVSLVIIYLSENAFLGNKGFIDEKLHP